MALRATPEEKAVKALCAAMRELGIEPEVDGDNMVSCILRGDDMGVGFHAFAENGRIQLAAIMSLDVPGERTAEVLAELNRLNLEGCLGKYLLHEDGMVTYEIDLLFMDDPPSKDLLGHLVSDVLCSANDSDGPLKALISRDG